jgi:DNA polymerase elongation subunit (family B)
VILEADTDGIYLSTDDYFSRPAELLAKVQTILPPGIELEHDGTYDAMFCYKAKNYALAADGEITLRGSALRSRGIEPFLKRLSDHLIAYLLGTSTASPVVEVERLRQSITNREHPVADLAKSESLSQNPAAYEQWVAGGGKPRRAAAEVALLMNPRPRMGERVSYYIGPKTKGRTSDWQRAQPLAAYHAINAPYAVDYYIVKIDDWLERYGRFLGIRPHTEQQELTL